MRNQLTLIAIVLCAVLGCGDDSPSGTDGGADRDGSPPDAANPDTGFECSDYRPGSADDTWPACISDDGAYHRIEPTISSIARVRAFESMADILFDPARDPTSDDFLEARQIYQEEEGLDSRVARRYDPHFDVPEGTDCTVASAAEANPDYCVGPAHLQPLILDAFQAGVEGTGGAPPRVHAARIEAALLWFFYVSTYKESLTCTTTAKDCDSSYAYYTGGETARGGIGLAADVQSAAPEAHDRAWDGLLAVRCWRDLDSGDVATDLVVRDCARRQYDRAVLDGVATLVRDRFERVGATSGDEQLYHHAFARTLGPVLLREMSERAQDDASVLETELGHTDPGAVDIQAAVEAIEGVFATR